MYKTELHCHSSDVSSCSRADVEAITKIYSEAGYTSLVLTNHFNSYTYDFLKCDSWDDFIDKFVGGCKKLRAAAENKLNILLGLELRNQEAANDYLIFGVDEEFLRKNPYIYNLHLNEIHTLVNEAGGILIQAHPFRNGMSVVDPSNLDGIEVFNGHKGHSSRNEIALAWASMHGFIMTSGTDFHYTHVIPNGGILTDAPILTENGLVNILKNGNYTLVTD